MRHSRLGGVVAAVTVLVASLTGARAEDVTKKFRVGFAVGGYNTQDEVRSSSANRLFLVDDRRRLTAVYVDPRNDNATIGDLKIEPGIRATLTGSYAFTPMFVLEAAVGYQKSDVGDIEVQAQFRGQEIPTDESTRFNAFPVSAGTMEQIPIQLTGFVRFRPKAELNPYVGAGIGYTVVGFESSAELDALSMNMDDAEGGLARLTNAIYGLSAPVLPSTFSDLEGARVDARDSFEWHLGGGMEYTIRKKWAAFADVRYMFASRAIRIGFNGTDALGATVPQRTENENSEFATQLYGPYYLPSSGLVDAGRLVPKPTAEPGTDCAVTPAQCVFEFQPDGVTDPGLYYVQGGTIKYGGISAQIGIRYTF